MRMTCLGDLLSLRLEDDNNKVEGVEGQNCLILIYFGSKVGWKVVREKLILSGAKLTFDL